MEEKFYSLLEQWKEVTCFKSWNDRAHPAYKEILAMGEAVIPLLLENISNSWLSICVLGDMIENHDHIPREHWGNFENLQKDWLKWGRNNGYLQ